MAEKLKDKYENFVVIGIGGSALGNVALQTALKSPFYNFLSREQCSGYPRIFVIDNIDPALISGLLKTLDISKTLFNVIVR